MKKYIYPSIVFILVFFLLAMVQLKVDLKPLLLERFIPAGGWIEIPVIALYGFIVMTLIHDTKMQQKVRLFTWTLFSVVFFSQLILGLSGFDKFLMTGKLHLPVPMMILGGTIYRLKISFMPILFISTIVLSGPAWCSQFCYFGALDGISSSRVKGTRKQIKNLWKMKSTGLIIIVSAAIILRISGMDVRTATLFAAGFGLAGVIIILTVSARKGKMYHCLAWCPIGTLVNLIRYINPFRLRINNSCTNCLRCTPVCRYDALSPGNISSGKPGPTCTLCGDCLASCKPGSIEYHFPGLSAVASRYLYLVITVTIHAVFLALARI